MMAMAQPPCPEGTFMMAMAQPPCPEFTIICIDNGQRALCCKSIYDAQLKGARYYCETVLKSNPDSMVSIFTMSSEKYGELVPPTNDLQQLLDTLKFVPCNLHGETEFQFALSRACSTFSRAPPKMKKRLIMFVGHTIHLHLMQARSYGEKLNESSVALDVFNFRLLKVFHDNDTILQGKYHYARTELEKLVNVTNANGNSRIVDIVDEYESSVLGTLSESTLQEHVHYLNQKAAADDEKNKSVVDKKNIALQMMNVLKQPKKKKKKS